MTDKAKTQAGRLAWTTTPPDREGWYWLQNVAQIRTAKPMPARVYRDKQGCLSVSGHTLEWWRSTGGLHFLWAGPIEEPPDALETMLKAKEAGR